MLRLGSHDDFDALYPIYMHRKVNPYLSFEIMSKELFRPIFDQLINSGTLFVYEQPAGHIAATCIARRGQRRCAHVVCLSTLATDPTCHRQGVGSTFVRDLIAHLAKDKQVKRIELYAEADNDIALKFYQKLGFHIEGCLRKYYKRADDSEAVDELILGMLLD